MAFSTTIANIRQRIEQETKRDKKKDEKLLAEYWHTINRTLNAMKTTEKNIVFPRGRLHLLQQLAVVLNDEGFIAHVHKSYTTPESVILYIRIPEMAKPAPPSS